MTAISRTGAPLLDSSDGEGEDDAAELLVRVDFPGTLPIGGDDLGHGGEAPAP